ncbi:succinate dehydrogenase [Knoellia sinensis KCTC 19936]|uniref:Succinate dehydrogenase n=1 Tax=Knoellia sinensis KCTC 19936 TaxID=1385520 RepID=A0A0A0IYD2_9MICO|nr:succinate dehydrogenase cytochrome b subunit [Knoellia sinensis]KGN30205.1 succinate dehydrogenase [Knoellia sinensis KCTC 19936]
MPTTTLSPRTNTARSTTIALKLLMAVTGLVFVGYLILHAYGNLKALAGEEAFNTYAHHLRTFGEPMLPYGGLLWAVRIILILSLIGHVYAAFRLWSRAGSARRTKYAAVKTAATSQWMRWGGVFILVFVVWHLLHFTIVKISPNADKQGAEITANPYQLVVASFEVWWMVIIYVLAMVALFMHLKHGFYSAQQTLGLTGSPKANARAKTLGLGVAALIVVAFLIPPLSIAFGLIN